jgi:hypothetical protein
MCLSQFIYWKYRQSSWYFRPSFVNCCPSNLLSSSTLPSLPCVNKYTVYTYSVQCVRGYGVLGLRQTNTCRKVPSQVNFKIRNFALPSMSLIFVPYRRKTPTNFCNSDLQSNMCGNTEHRKLVIYCIPDLLSNKILFSSNKKGTGSRH